MPKTLLSTTNLNFAHTRFLSWFSVVGGVGCGLVLVQGNVTVQRYFDKRCFCCSALKDQIDFHKIAFWICQPIRRGIANGIFMSGGALGNMLMPVLLRLKILPESIMDLTTSQINPSYECRKWMKVKMAKWCWKKWNGPILMHIYDKQCEIMQKNQWKGPNCQIQCFHNGTSGALC